MPDVPRVFIYCLRCPVSGEAFYVGKTIHPQVRERWHLNWDPGNRSKSARVRTLLSQGLNPQFEILEQCSEELWRERERFWEDRLRAEGAPLTNLRECGIGQPYFPHWHEKTWEGFLDPSGLPLSIHNLVAFCREHGLSHGNMKQVHCGRRDSHKGYTCPRTETSELRTQRAEQRRAARRLVGEGLRGVPRPPDVIEKWHAGISTPKWRENNRRAAQERACRPESRAATAARFAKEWAGFIDPQGNEIPPFSNLTAFCRERGLQPALMWKVYSGKRPHHKGYTYRES